MVPTKMVSNKCDYKNAEKSLHKLVELLEHPISESHTERQLELLDDLINLTTYAFWLKDIPAYIRFFEAMTKKVNKIPEFQKPLESLLLYAAMPPMMTKSSDMIEFARDFEEFFSMLGCLMVCLKDNHMKRLVMDVISSLLKKKTFPVGMCCVSPRYIQEVARKSQLIEICGHILDVTDDDLYLKLLRIIYSLINDCESTSRRLAKENAIEYLLRRLHPRGVESPTILQCVEPDHLVMNYQDTCRILWILLNSIDGCAEDVELPSAEALRTLRHSLKILVRKKAHPIDRNNLMALILKLLKVFKNLDLKTSGLAKEIACMSVATEICTECGCNVFTTTGPSADDYQFKRISLACLPYLFQHGAEQAIVENEVIVGLTQIITHRNKKWGDEEYCELSLIVLRILPRIVKHDLKVFLAIDGPLLIIDSLKAYLEKIYEKRLLMSAIHSLYEILIPRDKAVIENVMEHNGYEIVLNVCHKLLGEEILDRHVQKCLARGLIVLQILCEHNRKTINPSEIDLCVNYMKRLVHPPANDPPYFRRAIVCALHYAWEVIVKKPKHLDAFIRIGGVYDLLDIIYTFSYTIKLIALGILADIAYKGLGIPFLITWRKKGYRLLPMLMEIFRGEEGAFCAHSAFETEIRLWDHTSNNICKKQGTNMNIDKQSLMDAIRPKIYAILNMLFVKYKDVTQIANEHYGLFNVQLDTDDKVTRLFEENFVSLELCEAWLDINRELKQEGIEPTPEDAINLQDLVQRIRKWKLCLYGQAEECIRNEFMDEQIKEACTYNDLKSSRLAEALEALRELSRISKCTEHMYLVMRRMRQLGKQEACLRFEKDATHHRTAMENLTITDIYDQVMDIQSNVVEKRCRDKEGSFILEISPVDSEVTIDIREGDDLLSGDSYSTLQCESTRITCRETTED